MTVRVEVVTDCQHGYSYSHLLSVKTSCHQATRRSFTEWPPEAIEAAYVKVLDGIYQGISARTITEAALAAVWETLTGDNK